MSKLKRSATKRSHSWWWDSHISPKNSKWLSEHLEEMDLAVKRMLKLIEEDADTFAKKAEMYYQKRPELIAHVEDFYRMYRALAERYDQVTGELRKNIPAALQPQGSGSGSDFGSESPSPSPSPDKPVRSKRSNRAAGFEVFLGSDNSFKNSDGSSSSSESESDSDEVTSMQEEKEEHGECQHKIRSLESELLDVRGKLQAFEDGKQLVENGTHETLDLKITRLEDELSKANDNIHFLEEEIAQLKHELQQKESSELVHELQLKLDSFHEQNKLMEKELEFERNHARELQEKIVTLETDLAYHDHTIEGLKVEILNEKTAFLQEKQNIEQELSRLLESCEAQLLEERKRVSDLQVQIAKLQTEISDHENTIAELRTAISEASEKVSKEKLHLNEEISTLIESREKLESSFGLLHDELKQLKAEKADLGCAIEKLGNEKSDTMKQIELLHKEFGALQCRYDTTVAEKDELFAKLQALVAELSARDDRIKQMDEHLHRLHIEHMELIKGNEAAKRLAAELSERAKELEEEGELQKGIIADYAEGKREAIRQLCISLEHYRGGYEELKQALHGHHKSPSVLAS